MKKHFLLLVVLTFCVSGIYAVPIDPSRAINVAEQFMPTPASSSKIKGKQAPQQVSEIVYTHYMPADTENVNGGFPLFAPDSSGSTISIEEVDPSFLQGGDRGRLILRNGQIFILLGDKVYTIRGQEVK